MKKSSNYLVRFIKSSGIFFVGSILSKAASFFLLPLYTYLIPTQDMGIYDISVTILSMIQSAVYFEIWSAVLRFLYERQSEDEKNDVISASVLPFILQCTLMAGAAWLYGCSAHLNYVVWMMLYGVSQGATTYLGFIARGLDRNIDFALSGVICSVINLTLNVVLIAAFGWDYRALYVGYVVGAVAQTLYLAFRIGIFRRLQWRKSIANNRLTRELLRFSLPLCFNTVAYWFLASASKIIYNFIWGNSASGIFAIGQKFGTLITLVTTCFTFAWQDVLFSRANDPDQLDEFYSKGCDTYLRFLLTGMAVMLPVLRLIFPWFVKGDYAGAAAYIPLFILNALISGYSAFVGNLFYAIKDTKTIAISTILSAAVNLILSYPMIKLWGMYGANIACILAFCLNIAIRAYILRGKIGFRLYWDTFLKYAAWIAASTFVYNFNHGIVLIIYFFISLGLAYLLNRGFIIGFFKKGGGRHANDMRV